MSAVLGTGRLVITADGMARGSASFPIRGTLPVLFRRGEQVKGVWTATLQVGADDRADMILCRPIPGLDADTEPHWHGHIFIQGYEHVVRISQPPEAVTFFDTRQRDQQT